ncbi:16S rRNA (cytosine(967)-C(5))-methyltransferase RsmB [bacterium]|nr:16S rRNA (cytosine(967)-C(5))-methyltransferase RsmB [bacterium]
MGDKVHNPRRIAAQIIAEWSKGNRKIDEIRDKQLGSDEGWDERDRGLVTEIAYGVVRQAASIDLELEGLVTSGLSKMQLPLAAILRVGLYQIRYLDRVPSHAAVSEAVDHAKALFGDKAGGLVNAVLRRAAADSGRRPVDAFYVPASPLGLWRRKWLEQWGEEKTDELIRAFETIPPIGLRRNLLKSESDEAWLELLKQEGVEATPFEGWPGFAYARGIKPGNLPSFEAGITTVQDPATGISVRALDPQPGESILDLCGAPGGKAAHIWERMQGKGSLLTVDKNMKRNKLSREGLKRLGHESVEVRTEDVIHCTEGQYDRVLIDVPCSGTGVAHRRADLLINRHPLQVDKLARMQRMLLAHASKLVKPGGILVYSTCSLEPQENMNQARGFDKKYGDQFVRDELPSDIPDAWRGETGEASTWPPDHKVDGAYVVRWRRVA